MATKKQKQDVKQAIPKSTVPAIPKPTPTFKEMHETLLNALGSAEDPRSLIPKAYESIVTKKESPQKEGSTTEKTFLALAFENDHSLVETVDERYRGMTIQLRRQLIKDFNCTTYAEKVLVDAIVSGYMRNLKCARTFNGTVGQGSTTAVLNGFLAIISKEMDRANRHMLVAYQTLVNLKKPPINVQVKAQNAFVAQNQQLNVGQKVG